MSVTTLTGNHATGFALCLYGRRWAYSSGILSGGNAFISNHSARCKGGCFHLPSNASGLGQKRRKKHQEWPTRRRQPIRFLVLARRIVLDVQCHAPVSVAFQI